MWVSLKFPLQTMYLWQEYHKSDAVFFSSHPRNWHMFSIYSITDDDHLSYFTLSKYTSAVFS